VERLGLSLYHFSPLGVLMAEQTHSGTAELGAPMDYEQHEKTYDAFTALTKLTVVASIITLVSLALFGFGGGAGFWLGTLLLVLMIVALAIGLAAKGTVKPLVGVLVLGLVFMVLTVA